MRTVGFLLQRGCHLSSEPIRQPANDLIAFDIRRQSPEQIANLFARWKEQRQRLQASGPRRSPPHLKSVPPIVHGAAEETAEAAPTTVSGAVRYSASFEALLAREPTLAQRVWNPDAGLAKLGRAHPPRRRSKTKWLLAGAASVIAVAAVAGGALWEQSAGRTGWMHAADKPDNALVAKPIEAPATTYPMDIPMAEPFVAKATASRQADWPMRQAVDLALMKTAPVVETAHLPLMPQLKPPVPVVQTASKAPPEPQPEAAPREAPVARVELPLEPRVTTATVSLPVTPATEAHKDDAHPNTVTRRGKDKDIVPFGSNERVASSGSRPTGAAGSGASKDPASGSAGGSTGGGRGGDDPSGGAGGGGNTGGGDTGGGDPGGGDSGGGNTGGGSSGGDGSGEGGESGESGEGGSADSGGIGGAIGGALGGLGNALGGGKGDPDGDKDKDKQKSKEKAD
jgi:uncharacterized membrane protein YgcG